MPRTPGKDLPSRCRNILCVIECSSWRGVYHRNPCVSIKLSGVCRWSMIMSGSKCSVKMSVYGRTDVDDERTGKDTGVERSDHRRGECGGWGRADGSERAPCVATAGSLQEGGSICHSSRQQGKEAIDDHGHGYTTEGQGVGRRPVRRAQPHPSDRTAVRARGD